MSPVIFTLILLILTIGITPIYGQLNPGGYEVPRDQAPTLIENEYIVTLHEPIDNGDIFPLPFAGELISLQEDSQPKTVFLLKTNINEAEIMKLDTRIKWIQPNTNFHTTGFSNGMPFGMDRIQADLRANYNDGIDNKIDVDVAVMDTGIRQQNPDYNIVTCIDFTGGGSCTDNNGHGSHTAGTVGAIDNGGNNIIGVAEGVRLHILKVCPTGSCPLNALIAASNYIAANADVIDVVNVSIGGVVPQTNTSCTNVIDAWQQAMCDGYEKGVVYVVSAGNGNSNSTDLFIPCTWEPVLCVSAILDSDGKPGGVGPGASCRSGEQDDRMASFSNFGQVVRINAPGVCVVSYDNNGNPWTISGTSMSSPHVAGSAALVVEQLGKPTTAAGVELVRQFLIDNGCARDGPCGWTGDKDNFAEPLVQVDFISGPIVHDMVLVSYTADPIIVQQGDIVDLQATIMNDGNVFEEKTSIRYRDTLTRTAIASQFRIDISPSQTIVGDVIQWDTTGAILGDHVLRAQVKLQFPDDVPSNNELFITVTVVDSIPPPPECESTDFECRLDAVEDRVSILEGLHEILSNIFSVLYDNTLISPITHSDV